MNTNTNKSKGRGLELTGMTFGELTVLRKVEGKTSKERSFIWECRCSCGKIVEIPANQLMKGYHKRCGCMKVKHLKEVNQYIEGTSLKMVFSDTVRTDNTSGYKGVYRKADRWAARIQYKGKRYFLGTFDKLEDAIQVRKEAEEKIREVCTQEYLSLS